MGCASFGPGEGLPRPERHGVDGDALHAVASVGDAGQLVELEGVHLCHAPVVILDALGSAASAPVLATVERVGQGQAVDLNVDAVLATLGDTRHDLLLVEHVEALGRQRRAEVPQRAAVSEVGGNEQVAARLRLQAEVAVKASVHRGRRGSHEDRLTRRIRRTSDQQRGHGDMLVFVTLDDHQHVRVHHLRAQLHIVGGAGGLTASSQDAGSEHGGSSNGELAVHLVHPLIDDDCLSPVVCACSHNARNYTMMTLLRQLHNRGDLRTR